MFLKESNRYSASVKHSNNRHSIDSDPYARKQVAVSLFSISPLSATVLLFFLSGCAPATRATNPDEQSVTSLQPTPSAAGPFTSYSVDTGDVQKLASLWLTRTQTALIPDYPLGPGDVIDISVPAMPELAHITVRVSAEGEISLPFVGVVKASGLTDKELRDEIRRRLDQNTMYDPQVHVYVKEYRSRQVAVVGAVEKPGLYSLASASDTILDMISEAGGMKKDAAPRINFIPAEAVVNNKPKDIISPLAKELVSKGSPSLIPKGVDPIVIDLDSFTRGGNEIYLTLPARPGDVIMVPGKGEVLVQGWVEKPGSYKISPGLRVLGAVAAAGGPLFAADISSVKIIRTDKHGEKKFSLANLESIKRGEETDFPVQEGDVVEISSSTPRLLAYGI